MSNFTMNAFLADEFRNLPESVQGSIITRVVDLRFTVQRMRRELCLFAQEVRRLVGTTSRASWPFATQRNVVTTVSLVDLQDAITMARHFLLPNTDRRVVVTFLEEQIDKMVDDNMAYRRVYILARDLWRRLSELDELMMIREDVVNEVEEAEIPVAIPVVGSYEMPVIAEDIEDDDPGDDRLPDDEELGGLFNPMLVDVDISPINVGAPRGNRMRMRAEVIDLSEEDLRVVRRRLME